MMPIATLLIADTANVKPPKLPDWLVYILVVLCAAAIVAVVIYF